MFCGMIIRRPKERKDVTEELSAAVFAVGGCFLAAGIGLVDAVF